MRKEIRISPTEVKIGDEIIGFGVVEFIRPGSYESTDFVYTSRFDGLAMENWDNDFKLTIRREVEKPNELSIKSMYGDSLLLEDTRDDNWVQLTVIDEIDGETSHGRMFKVDELIDAIKTVKGLD